MSECTNDGMRDLLPLLAHGSLDAAQADAVRTHVAACAACGAELAALETARLVLRAEAPRVDVAAIARAVTAATQSPAPALRVERGGAPAPAVARRSPWRSRQWLAAAASVLVVISLSLPMLGRRGEEGAVIAVPARPSTAAPADSPVAPAAPAAAPAGAVTVGQTLADLSSDDLSTLLAELEALEATIASEPSTMRRPLVDTPEVP